MTRQWVLDEIRKIREETNLATRIIASDGFLYQPRCEILRREYKKYRLEKEEWHQIVRFALSDKQEYRYMYERLLNLLLRHKSSYKSYFKLKTENSSNLLPNRLSEINKLLSLYKEYFKIFGKIINKIRFDYPLEKHTEGLIHGKINWNETLKKYPVGFPFRFETLKWKKKFDVPENTLLLLSSFWLKADSKKLLHMEFNEPLDSTEKSILNYIISKTQNIFTYFPFPEVIQTALRHCFFSYNDKRILYLQQLAQDRLGDNSNFSPYLELLEWIEKYKQLNIRMMSPNTTNYPLETLENLDTIYEAWIFFEFVDYFYNKQSLLKLQIEEEPYYFDFLIENHLLRFYYEKEFHKEGEHAWAVESRPDFSIMENNRIIAIFDAKNYGALTTSGGASHKMLAYMTNLDVGIGILFFPNFPSKEYKYPREKDNPAYHFNLLLGHYRLHPQGSDEAIQEKISSITRIHHKLTELVNPNKIRSSQK